MSYRTDLNSAISAVQTATKKAKAARDGRQAYINNAMNAAKIRAEKRADDKISAADIKVAEAKKAYQEFTGQSWVETKADAE